MKAIDLRPDNFEKACSFFTLFIIHFFDHSFGHSFGVKYRDQNTNYHLRHGITYITSSRGCSIEDMCANFAISVNIMWNFIECGH
jgi:hypothetical protein